MKRAIFKSLIVILFGLLSINFSYADNQGEIVEKAKEVVEKDETPTFAEIEAKWKIALGWESDDEEDYDGESTVDSEEDSDDEAKAIGMDAAGEDTTDRVIEKAKEEAKKISIQQKRT